MKCQKNTANRPSVSYFTDYPFSPLHHSDLTYQTSHRYCAWICSSNVMWLKTIFDGERFMVVCFPMSRPFSVFSTYHTDRECKMIPCQSCHIPPIPEWHFTARCFYRALFLKQCSIALAAFFSLALFFLPWSDFFSAWLFFYNCMTFLF